MLQLTQRGTTFRGNAAEVACLRATFERRHALPLPQFLPSPLLSYIQKALTHAVFEANGEPGFFAEVRLSPAKPIWDHLLFMMNDPALFHWVEQITGCDAIGRFSGRVYRRSPGSNHYDDWHDDDIETRMIGISVNLGRETFSGGALKLRDALSKKQIYEMANTGFGDAVLFSISEHLQHIVMPLEGTAERTALAGWFRREPDYATELNAAIVDQRPVPRGQADGQTGGLPAQLRLSDEALYHAAGDDLLVHVNGVSGVNGRARFYKLNGVGREILERLVATGTPATVIAHMMDEYDVPADELTQAVRRLVAELQSQWVLEAVN